ncbi:hypothetical protein FACS1894204_12490 [Synergistales bacterium]|nr:hypothetical protein FACS1894204_12490 [Synergistales bacterium]
MTTATLGRRESLIRRVRELPDSVIESVIEFIDDTEGYEPNEETVKVLEDSEAGRNLIGPYDSLENMFKDFGIDVNP